MSHDVNWDVDKYKEEDESEDQWELRKAFLLRWKDQYPEERLVCLARVFTNIEFMGCRYPKEVMLEVAKLSADIAKQYRNNKKTKLQRTFVSASDAAEDRARGVKREGGIIVDAPQKKSARIAFVRQGQNDSTETNGEDIKSDDSLTHIINRNIPPINIVKEVHSTVVETNVDEKSKNNVYINEISSTKMINYMEDLCKMKCLDPRDFDKRMFETAFGQFVLIIRPWTDMLNNLQSTCANLKMPLIQNYIQGVFTVTLGGQELVSTKGDRVTARAEACRLIWDKLRHSSVVLLLKEQFVSQNDSPISLNDMANKKKHEFGEPIEDSVALKMMKLMGWKGGGLGADSQGIAEPIKPNLMMVRRAGLGHEASLGLHELKRAGLALMRRRAVALDADLVFAADFTGDERAVLHKCANMCGLHSKSYGKGDDRFLVVSNKLRPFSLVPDLVECGGETRKYRVFIPASIRNFGTKK